MRRCEEYLHTRHMMMWLSLSNLQLYYDKPGSRSKRHHARRWRDRPNVAGHNWFLSSNWQQRTAKLYTLAGEVTRKLNGN